MQRVLLARMQKYFFQPCLPFILDF